MNTINSRASYMALAAFAVILGTVLAVGVAQAGLWFLVPVVAGMTLFALKLCVDITGDLKTKDRA